MTTKVNAFETGLANGTQLTPNNSGYTANDAFDEVYGVVKASTVAGYQAGGSLGVLYDVPATTVVPVTAGLGWVVDAATMYWRHYFYIPVGMPTSRLFEGRSRYGARIWAVSINKDGLLQLRDASGLIVATSTIAVTRGALCRLEGKVLIHGSNQSSNVLEVKLFNSAPMEATTPDETLTATGLYLGRQGKTTYRWRAGLLSPCLDARQLGGDGVGFSDTGYLGPLSLGTTEAWDWAAVEPWGGGVVTDITADPNTAGRFYAALDVGAMLRSDDHGETWAQKQGGMYLDGHRKCAAVLAADDPDDSAATRVFVGCGNVGADAAFLSSVDAGETWVHESAAIGFAAQAAQSPLAATPRSVGPLIVQDVTGGGDGYLYAGTYDQGVYRSTDGGANWTRIAMAPSGGSNYFIRCLALDPSDPTILYVGVANAEAGAGAYKLTDIRASPTVTQITPGGVTQVEEIKFIGSTMYAACSTAGMYRVASPYTSGNWTDISGTRISTSSKWCAVDGYDNAGNHVLVVGCVTPRQVDANGDAASSGIKYGSLYRTAAAQTGTPTWTYVSDPGTAGFPGGGDQDVDVLDYSTGNRYWMADEQPTWMLGRSGCMVHRIIRAPFADGGVTPWFATGGWDGAIWRSDDDGLTWRACVTGVSIAVNLGVVSDPTRTGYLLMGNMDHDVLLSDDHGLTWTRCNSGMTQSGMTTCHAVHIDYEGVWWAANNERDDSPNEGYLYKASGGIPFTPSWTLANLHGSVGNKRPLAIVSGEDGSSGKRIVVYVDNSGFWYTDNPESATPTWVAATGDPVVASVNNHRAAPMSLIWPDRTQPYLYFFQRGSGADAGVWRSSDRGASWVKIWANTTATDVREGYLAAAPGSYQVIYVTDGSTDITRIRDAHSSADRDTITNIDDPRAVAFDPDGNLYVWVMPTASVEPKVLRVSAPPGTGTTLTVEDLVDPLDLANDGAGQEKVHWCNALWTDGQRVLVTARGTTRGVMTAAAPAVGQPSDPTDFHTWDDETDKAAGVPYTISDCPEFTAGRLYVIGVGAGWNTGDAGVPTITPAAGGTIRFLGCGDASTGELGLRRIWMFDWVPTVTDNHVLELEFPGAVGYACMAIAEVASGFDADHPFVGNETEVEVQVGIPMPVDILAYCGSLANANETVHYGQKHSHANALSMHLQLIGSNELRNVNETTTDLTETNTVGPFQAGGGPPQIALLWGDAGQTDPAVDWNSTQTSNSYLRGEIRPSGLTQAFGGLRRLGTGSAGGGTSIATGGALGIAMATPTPDTPVYVAVCCSKPAAGAPAAVSGISGAGITNWAEVGSVTFRDLGGGNGDDCLGSLWVGSAASPSSGEITATLGENMTDGAVIYVFEMIDGDAADPVEQVVTADGNDDTTGVVAPAAFTAAKNTTLMVLFKDTPLVGWLNDRPSAGAGVQALTKGIGNDLAAIHVFRSRGENLTPSVDFWSNVPAAQTCYYGVIVAELRAV